MNYAELSNAVGIKEPTTKSWMNLLVSSGLVYLPEPYHKKINKRMIKKSPKIYFLDTGLCSYLAGYNTPEELEKGSMSDAIFKTFVVAEILKSYYHNDKKPPIYYYRDKDKREIDLIIEEDKKIYPIQIIKTKKPTKSDIKNFKVLSKFEEGAIICLCDEEFELTKNIRAIHVGYV